jgi:hypothetical protein
VPRGVEVENPPASVLDDEEAVQQLKGHHRYREEIQSHDHLAMISEECQPALAWITAPSETSKPSFRSSP